MYLKEIQEDNMTIAWFFYSAAYSESPDYIVATKGSAIDTICRANNIADINLEGDSIMIGFYGSPQLYGDPIEIPIRVMGYSVLIDTGYTRDSETAPRKFYQK
ncbi:hypothetical protein JCM30197_21700 [Schleiferia thermophila]|nr:hypothetical protein JCM30197_21700 [Schleiferia thermophila]